MTILRILLFLSPLFLYAQSARYDPGHKAISIFQEWDIQDTIQHEIHTGLKYYFRKDLANYAARRSAASYSPDRDFNYIIKDNRLYDTSEVKADENKGIFKVFYKSDANFLQVEKPAFSIYINPILNFSLGSEVDREHTRFTNTRGLELYGSIDNKVYFYTNILENQGNFHNFLEKRINKHKAIPGYSFFKPFRSSIIESFVGHDYANAIGYLGVPISKHVNIELGHGNHFIGHGYQSLLLGNYANNYFYLKLNTRVWKFNYQNLWMELAPISTRLNPRDELIPKKYMAAHYLSFKPTKAFEIGLFESVIFSRLNQFEFHYLNPIILFRAVEYYLDSPDNVMLGINGKLNLFRTFSLYGQLAIDDLKFSELFKRNGWWGNKVGIQAGLFYPDVAKVNNLDLRLEANIVRPYTYGHRDTVPEFDNYSIANYSSYNQPLAHPLGANFIEMIGIVDYSPISNLDIQIKWSIAKQGRSNDDIYAGDDILVPNEARPEDFNIDFLIGTRATISQIEFNASYEFYHNYWIDLTLLKRQENFPQNIDTQYFGLGLRANIHKPRFDY